MSSDLGLEVLEAGAPDDIPEQQVMTKVRSVERLTNGVIKLHLQTLRTNRLRFLAGQRVNLGMAKGGCSISRSMIPVPPAPTLRDACLMVTSRPVTMFRYGGLGALVGRHPALITRQTAD